jgi:predicted regulator of Ras-like GTPase activity (Roadblock/LC7/MglB family)
MDAQQALADLMEISSQVEAAVLLTGGGDVVAATLPDERARAFARAVRELVDAASADERTLTQLEAATGEGSVFVVREGDRLIAAATGASPTVGLVFYDLKTCLRALAAEPEKKRRRRKAAAVPEGGDDAA